MVCSEVPGINGNSLPVLISYVIHQPGANLVLSEVLYAFAIWLMQLQVNDAQALNNPSSIYHCTFFSFVANIEYA